jgi:hypothetical protein
VVAGEASRPIWIVPEISRFFRIVIGMHFEDHMPPHFHGRNWFLRVAELAGVFSQVSIGQAEGMARDAIKALWMSPPDSFEVAVGQAPEDLRDDLASVGHLRAAIERNERNHANLTRRFATKLVERERLTVHEAGRILGVSNQRVAQLVAAVEQPIGTLTVSARQDDPDPAAG